MRSGEVLGIGGLIGAGRTELLLALFGAPPGRRGGTIAVAGHAAAIGSPAAALALGLALLAEDRAALGLYPDRTVADNVTLAALRSLSGPLFTAPAREREAADRTVRELRITPPDPAARAGALSGGNQQKVLLGRWLLTRPRVLLLDEPTRGVDIGARQEIYAEIDRLARQGLAIVVVSSDLPELVGLSDRVLVLRQGRIAGAHARGCHARGGHERGQRRCVRRRDRWYACSPSVTPTPLLSVIVPVYNEASTVKQVVDRLREVPLPLDREIIVVDDGSTDGTGEVLRGFEGIDPGLVIVRATRNGGKGAAVRLGLTRSRGTIIAIQDADLELDPAELRALVQPVLEGRAAVVYGSRFLNGRPDAPFATIAGNRFLTSVTNVLYGASLTDMETCYKIMAADLARSLDLTSNSFDLEPENHRQAPAPRHPHRRAARAVRAAFEGRRQEIRWRHGFTALAVLVRERFARLS